MKRILLLTFILALQACEIYEEPSYPGLYMGGGKWTFIDYDIAIINSITSVTIVKNDTICINSFGETMDTNMGIIMKQDFNYTAISRRFIKNRTQWEFDGSNLFCEWMNTSGGMKPSHEPLWVSYPNYLYTNYARMSIFDGTMGTVTDYTFKTNNNGVGPPNELILTSPDIVINLYSSSDARDKAVTLKVVLTFMR